MSLNFLPDLCFRSFDCVSPEFLVSLGIKGIILDVDNTLEPYENPLPSDKVKIWLESLRLHGISAAIVSNNDASRIDVFNSEIGIPAFSKAGKPFKKNVILAMSEIGSDATNTVLMGDQVFTDVWAAHNAGIKAILVPPIKDKTDFFTKLKRILEKPILKKYERKYGKIK